MPIQHFLTGNISKILVSLALFLLVLIHNLQKDKLIKNFDRSTNFQQAKQKARIPKQIHFKRNQINSDLLINCKQGQI